MRQILILIALIPLAGCRVAGTVNIKADAGRDVVIRQDRMEQTTEQVADLKADASIPAVLK